MEDNISFLSNKDNNPKKKNRKDGSGDLKWSKPAEGEKTDFLKGMNNLGGKAESKSSGLFSFFKKNDQPLEKKDLEHSRQEVLKAISDHEIVSGKMPNKAQKNTDNSGFWGSMFKKKEKGIKIDLQADFKAEKGKIAIKEAVIPAPKTPSRKEIKNLDPIFTVFSDKQAPDLAFRQTSNIESSRINLLNRLIDRWSKNKKNKDKNRDDKEVVRLMDEKNKEEKILMKEEVQAVKVEAIQKDKEVIIEKKEKSKKKKENILEDSNVLETNLMEGESISFFDWQKNSLVLSAFAFLAVMIVAFAYGGLVIYSGKQSIKSKSVDDRIEKLKLAAEEVKEDTKSFSALESKIKLVSTLLDRHIYWTNFFQFLEDKTLVNIYYFNFSGDNSGKYVMASRAKSFSDLSKQLTVFKQATDQVDQVNIKGGKLGTSEKDKTTGVDFGLEITVNPDIFYKK